MTRDVKFEFLGFDPDERMRYFVSTVAETIHFSAPSDSTLKIVVEKSRDAILASCRIVSQSGTFVADAISDNPVKAIQLIEKKIREQLDSWKRHRFEKKVTAKS